MHWLQHQFTPCEALPIFLLALLDSILKLAVIPVACAHFPIQFLPSSQLYFNFLWYSTPWRATPFSNDPLWLTLFVEGINDHLLDHCQVSSVPHYCGFKEQEIATIFWDTDFWLSLAVCSNHRKLKQKSVIYIYIWIYESFTFYVVLHVLKACSSSLFSESELSACGVGLFDSLSQLWSLSTAPDSFPMSLKLNVHLTTAIRKSGSS